jgi:hypothetical protein
MVFVPLTLAVEGFPIRDSGEPATSRFLPSLNPSGFSVGFRTVARLYSHSPNMTHHLCVEHIFGFNHVNLLGSNRISYSSIICDVFPKVK